MNLFSNPITILHLGDNFLEIHYNLSYKSNQRIIFFGIFVLILIPLVLIPVIFTIQSLIYPLFISLILLGVLFNLSSDHLVVKCNTIHNRFDCIFDSDSRNSKMFTTYLSQLDTILITKAQTTIETDPKLSGKKRASKSMENSYVTFQFNNNVNITIGPIIGAKTNDLVSLQSELRIFFEKNMYSIKFSDLLKSKMDDDDL